MIAVRKALKLHRLGQFLRTLRTEGLRAALSRTVVHLRMLKAGQIPSDIADQTGCDQAQNGRFAMSAVWSDLSSKTAFEIVSNPALLTQKRNVVLIGDLNLPQCRKYRVEQLDEIFAKAGVSFRFAHYEDIPRCRDIMQTATHLIVYRVARCDLLTMYLYEARRLRLSVMYDIDDPLFSVPAYETYSNMSAVPKSQKDHFVSEAPLYADAMNMADVLSFSTQSLLTHARQFSNRPAFVRRNFADLETLRIGGGAMQRERGPHGLRLAFSSGSDGHGADFRLISDHIAEFLAADKTRELMVLGKLDHTGLPTDLCSQVQCRPFTSYPAYLRQLATADCALLPLTDDLFNGCKSAVRAIDAAAVGVPSIVSNVGDLGHFVTDKATGIVAKGPEGWRLAFGMLDAAPESFSGMGQDARRDLETRWAARLDSPVIDPEFLRWVQD